MGVTTIFALNDSGYALVIPLKIMDTPVFLSGRTNQASLKTIPLFSKFNIGDGPECYTMENGEDYRGNVANAFGDTCMNWSTLSSYYTTDTHPDKGHGEHNYCRNPDGDLSWSPDGAWCYIMYVLPDERELIKSHCDIGQPKTSCIGTCILCNVRCRR